MNCPACYHNKLKVIDTRTAKDGSRKRRRECQQCGHVFKTVERTEPIQEQRRAA